MRIPRFLQNGSKARAVYTLLFVLWLCIVWGHSLVGGESSSNESAHFIFLLRPMFSLAGSEDEELMTHVLRKTAHFCEYAILMGLAWSMWRAWFSTLQQVRILTLCVLVLVPCIDEFLQLHVPGRSGSVLDVLLDIVGGLFGLAVLALAMRVQKHDTSEAS